ncbi:MAG TPA: SAM-dependent methyltransferase [Planctomycetota bacterium]|nr:SAM-dependent methyltransferase [Planctomycetota bacterium]
MNPAYQVEYERLMQSGLYGKLAADGSLVAHSEGSPTLAATAEAYKVLCPEELPFISYPYEWCFSQLKDAALLTLRIQAAALAHGMSLKDASAFNVQFRNGRPVFIDTLSFESYREGRPWIAYRQFCEQFLAPLALMSRVDVRLGRFSRSYIEGIPLDLASAMLPIRTRFNLSLGLHVHAHSRSYRRAARQGQPPVARFSRHAFDSLLASLEATVSDLQPRRVDTEWARYYDSMHAYGDDGLADKGCQLRRMLESIRPGTVWDLGANTGIFSRIATECGAFTVAFDDDPGAVELAYRRVVEDSQPNLLPLWLDILNPSPGLGWAHLERSSLADRGPVDLVMALGLIHHLAIGGTVPFERIATFLARLGEQLIIEFVPKSDPQVGRMLSTREDVFDGYDRHVFEQAFAARYTIEQVVPLQGTERSLYSMRRRASS